jgi:N utilization substance protein B
MKAVHFREVLFRLVYSGFFSEDQIDFLELLSSAQEEITSTVTKKDTARLNKAYEWIQSNRESIQEGYEPYLKNWSFGRLTKVDSSLLLVAAYELSERNDAPYAVVINEAIELAKRYGKEGSPKFINGVLASYVKGKGYGESPVSGD